MSTLRHSKDEKKDAETSLCMSKIGEGSAQECSEKSGKGGTAVAFNTAMQNKKGDA